jgi:choline kinase
MKVAMLAAGIGQRLGMGADAPPKALLRFDGQSLLERHLAILAHFGLFDLTVVVGHQAGAIERELRALNAADRVRTCVNPAYRTSSRLSLWTLRDVLTAGHPVLYMDADVL